VGTFKFIAKSLGIPLDAAVNYFIWSIMLVFDPLAVCLILAYNTLIGKKKEEVVSTVTPTSTPLPTPTPTASSTPEPTSSPSPTPEPTPEPTQEQVVQEPKVDEYNQQLQDRIEPPPAPNEPFLRDYERFSRPNP
jgi:hypothetical protein